MIMQKKKLKSGAPVNLTEELLLSYLPPESATVEINSCANASV